MVARWFGCGNIVMGLLFFRGGSAQVARYLSTALADAHWSVELVTGSLGDPGEFTHTPTFFAGTPLQHLDYSDAVRVFTAGGSAGLDDRHASCCALRVGIGGSTARPGAIGSSVRPTPRTTWSWCHQPSAAGLWRYSKSMPTGFRMSRTA